LSETGKDADLTVTFVRGVTLKTHMS